MFLKANGHRDIFDHHIPDGIYQIFALVSNADEQYKTCLIKHARGASRIDNILRKKSNKLEYIHPSLTETSSVREGYRWYRVHEHIPTLTIVEGTSNNQFTGLLQKQASILDGDNHETST